LFYRKTSFFTAASNLIDPPFEFGVGRVDLMDWFHPLAYPGQPWRDLVISYGVTIYLSKIWYLFFVVIFSDW